MFGVLSHRTGRKYLPKEFNSSLKNFLSKTVSIHSMTAFAAKASVLSLNRSFERKKTDPMDLLNRYYV